MKAAVRIGRVRSAPRTTLALRAERKRISRDLVSLDGTAVVRLPQ